MNEYESITDKVKELKENVVSPAKPDKPKAEWKKEYNEKYPLVRIHNVIKQDLEKLKPVLKQRTLGDVIKILLSKFKWCQEYHEKKSDTPL